MGGIFREIEAYAENERIAWKTIYDRDVKERGMNREGGENGSLYGCVLRGSLGQSFEKNSEKNNAKINRMIENYENSCDKYEFRYVNCGLDHYEIWHVTEEVVKHQDPRSVYVCRDKNGKVIFETDDKLRAKAKAVSFSLNEGNELTIKREVRYSNRENDDLYRYNITKKRVEKKCKPKKNERLVPIYKFIFVGVSSY